MQGTDHQTADNIDTGNHQPRNGVPPHELAGAVHGPVKIGFPRNVAPALAGLILVYQTGIEVRVDGHLLTRHSIQCEAGGYLGNAGSTLSDYQEIDQHQDQENDEAHDIVAGHHEAAEPLDHLTGVALAKYQAGGGHV